MFSFYYKLGDRVTWTSQARGATKTKTGTVVEVVPKGGRPNRSQFPSLYKDAGVGFSRTHESYVVSVPNKRSGVKIYWPLVRNLRDAS
jgi:hypothetical protein